MQDVYKAMLHERISPAVRQLGLTGSGGRYVLASSTHWAMIGFQKSSYSHAAAVKFTVNALCVSRRDWDRMTARSPHFGTRPKPLVHYSAPARSERIGTLAGGDDKWWTLASISDVPEVAAEVIGDLTTFAVPWLHEHITR